MIQYDATLDIAGHLSKDFLDEIRDADPSATIEFQDSDDATAARLDDATELAEFFEAIGSEKVGKMVVFGNSDTILRQMEEICVRHQVAFVSRIEPLSGEAKDRDKDLVTELRIFAPEHEDDLGEILAIPASSETIDIDFLRGIMNKRGPQQVARILSYAAEPEQVLPRVVTVAPEILQSLKPVSPAPAV